MENTSSSRQLSSGLVFRTQLAAVAYLQAQGFKVGKSKFNADAKAGRVATTQEGRFESGALLAYAAVHLTPLARAEDAKSLNAAAQKLSADAQLKEIQAKRQQLKFEREQGLYMLKSDHEAELSSRATFFKNELEGFGLRALPALIALVGGREDALQEALEWWTEKTADLMDAWSKDREFAAPDDDALPAVESGPESGNAAQPAPEGGEA